MKVYFAADHAGFELKNTLVTFVRDEMKLEVEDCGAYEYDEYDDYPAIMAIAARKLVADGLAGVHNRAILIGGSGQGEAMAANRLEGVRAAVYYGPASQPQTDSAGNELDMIASIRFHNDSNVLALGARFLSTDAAKDAVRRWLTLEYPQDGRHDEAAYRHEKRIAKLDNLL